MTYRKCAIKVCYETYKSVLQNIEFAIVHTMMFHYLCKRNQDNTIFYTLNN